MWIGVSGEFCESAVWHSIVLAPLAQNRAPAFWALEDVRMANALVRQEAPAHATPSSRAELLARYRNLRRITGDLLSQALDLVSDDAITHQARRLGLPTSRSLVYAEDDEMRYVYDLAVHTAPPGRSRAVDRLADARQFPQDSDEALMLQAMRSSQFTVFRVERRHDVAGLIVMDTVRERQLWLVDEGMECTAHDGDAFAMRIYTPDAFAITAGTGVACDRELLEDALDLVPQLGRKKNVDAAMDDRRFAEAIYRVALVTGVSALLRTQDPLQKAG
jgi:hypothetical protein